MHKVHRGREGKRLATIMGSREVRALLPLPLHPRCGSLQQRWCGSLSPWLCLSSWLVAQSVAVHRRVSLALAKPALVANTKSP